MTTLKNILKSLALIIILLITSALIIIGFIYKFKNNLELLFHDMSGKTMICLLLIFSVILVFEITYCFKMVYEDLEAKDKKKIQREGYEAIA